LPIVYIDCPSCGHEGKIDESVLGRRIKCPKCGGSFKAEIGGSYDLEPDANRPAQAKPKPKAGADPVDPGLEKLLDDWASE
jgi:hypothetical protein